MRIQDFNYNFDKSLPYYHPLTEKEWNELCTLEYVSTWGYEKDDEEKKRNFIRHQELSNRRWEYIDSITTVMDKGETIPLNEYVKRYGKRPTV